MQFAYVVTLTAAMLAGCVSFTVPSRDSRPNIPIPPRIQEYYAYSKSAINLEEILLNEKSYDAPVTTDNYAIRRFTFPSSMHTTDRNDTVTIDYYQLTNKEKSPLVFISPILGGDNTASKWVAEYFANRGLACAIVHRQKDRFPDPPDYANTRQYSEALEAILRQGIIDMRMSMDVFSTFEEIDDKKYAWVGLSMGAMKVACLAAVDQRSKASALVMGGADFSYILRHTEEEGAQIKMEEASYGQPVDALLIDISKEVKTDPRYLAPYLDEKNTWMLIPLVDHCVATQSQYELRDLIGKPKVMYHPFGHYGTAILAYFWPYPLQRALYNFVTERLDNIESDPLPDLKGVSGIPTTAPESQ